MSREVDSQETDRAEAFELWLRAPMPMVTLFKTLDVSPLLKLKNKKDYKFNMLMCWCIGKAAINTKEFFLLPVGNKLMKYEKLAINTIIATKEGKIKTCDIPLSQNLGKFNKNYLQLTTKVYETSESYNLNDEYMIIGTSALAEYEIDGAVNIYAGFYNNPFLIWGRYRKKLFKTLLPVSFQFHHTQMDGIPAAKFLDDLAKEINSLKKCINII